jgi:tetratricopeptide (TPR) repeat protein
MMTQQIGDTEHRHEAEQLLANPQGPDDQARAYVILGVLSEHEQDWQAAVANYRSALAAVPHHPHTLYFSNNNLGYSLIQLCRFDEAEDYCVAAIEVDEHRHNAHKNLGLVYQGQGRCLDAAFCFAAAYRRNPRDPRAWRHLEQLLQTRPNLLRQHESLRREVDGLRQMIETGGCSLTH